MVRCRKGFTLIEILIAMGLVSIVGMAVMSLTQTSLRSSKNFGQVTDFLQWVNTANLLFNSPSTCPKTGLVGLTIPNPTAVTPA